MGAIEAAARDRRFSRAPRYVSRGGNQEAIGFGSDVSTPDLPIPETTPGGDKLLMAPEGLAAVCADRYRERGANRFSHGGKRVREREYLWMRI